MEVGPPGAGRPPRPFSAPGAPSAPHPIPRLGCGVKLRAFRDFFAGRVVSVVPPFQMRLWLLVCTDGGGLFFLLSVRPTVFPSPVLLFFLRSRGGIGYVAFLFLIVSHVVRRSPFLAGSWAFISGSVFSFCVRFPLVVPRAGVRSWFMVSTVRFRVSIPFFRLVSFFWSVGSTGSCRESRWRPIRWFLNGFFRLRVLVRRDAQADRSNAHRCGLWGSGLGCLVPGVIS